MTDELLVAFRRAVRLEVRVRRCPAWRPRARRRLEAELDRAAAHADAIRASRGAPPDAEPLAELLRATRP